RSYYLNDYDVKMTGFCDTYWYRLSSDNEISPQNHRYLCVLQNRAFRSEFLKFAIVLKIAHFILDFVVLLSVIIWAKCRIKQCFNSKDKKDETNSE
ncbi:MAG: hypothetical protein MHPSP_003096, partial [Paramarteilia canceri]